MRSPFTGLRFARMELDNFRAGTMIKIALIAISLIPLIYAGLFLLAFLDPYGSLVDVPAAVVNQDSGAQINGEQRNVGQELCDELVKNNEERTEGQASGYNWQFVDADDAQRGLEDGSYYMELIIPSDFSSNIASADSDSPVQSVLQVYFNPSTNLIAQTVGNSMVTKIKAELNEKIDKEYFNQIFVKIDDAADQLQDAVDGTDELKEGLDKLEDGSSTLTSGISSAKSGAEKLESGAQSAKSGSAKLGSGIKSAESGSKKITKNLGTLSSGASKVSKGVDTVGSNLSKLDKGIAAAQKSTASLSTVVTGVANALTAYSKTAATDSSAAQAYLAKAKTLAAAAQKANSTIGKDLNTYVSDLVSKLSTYQTALAKSTAASKTMNAKKEAMETAQKATSDPTKDLKEKAASFQTDLESSDGLGAALTQFNTDYAKSPTDYATLLKDAGALAKAAAKVVSGKDSGSGVELLLSLNTFNAKLTAYQTTASEYQDAASSYQEAATDMASAGADAKEAQGLVTGYLTGVSNTSKVAGESTSTVASAVKKLSKAVNGSLSSGAKAVSSGSSKLESGSATLTSGLATASSGSDSLTNGLSTLASGTNSLVIGLGDAQSGSNTITTNLGTASDGAQELYDGIKDGQEEMKDNAANSDGKSEMMSTPVTANGENATGESITEVKNYGTGFAPYFIALGLWVGALMISMIMSCLNNRILMSSASSVSAVLASYIPMATIALLQVIILLLFIQFGLKMTISHLLAYYLFGLLTALCFIAIIQFFRSVLGTTGLVAIVVLLMLQLCSAGGTFPIQAELPFFNWINPCLPMTYVVHGFRMAMTGLSTSYMWGDAAVLAAFMFAFLFLTIMWARHRRRVVMTQLYKPLKLAE